MFGWAWASELEFFSILDSNSFSGQFPSFLSNVSQPDFHLLFDKSLSLPELR